VRILPYLTLLFPDPVVATISLCINVYFFHCTIITHWPNPMINILNYEKQVQIINVHVYMSSLSIIPNTINCATLSPYSSYLKFSSFSTFIFISWDVILSVDYSSQVTYFKKSNIFWSNYFLFNQWLLKITGNSCHWNCKTLV
jgi:hypothetical protein